MVQAASLGETELLSGWPWSATTSIIDPRWETVQDGLRTHSAHPKGQKLQNFHGVSCQEYCDRSDSR